MNNDIQEIVSDNLSLKRAYQLAKLHAQKLQQSIAQKSQTIDDLQTKNEELSSKYTQLNKKYRKLQAQNQANSSGFYSQIEELKSLIEQKQQELQTFQLRMIPNLDQDMLRVKLINEMEGPYQEAMEKKQRQMTKLKDEIQRLKRNKEMSEYSKANTEKVLKQEIMELKKFYEDEVSRLTKQITHITCKKNPNNYDNQLIRGYRFEIEELKIALQNQKTFQNTLATEINQLKDERDKLLAQICKFNSNKQFQISEHLNTQEVAHLKKDKVRLEELVYTLERDLEKVRKNYRVLQEEKISMIKDFQLQLRESRQQQTQKRESLQEQILELKGEIRRVKELKARQQSDFQQISEKYHSLKLRQESLVSELKRLQIHSQGNFSKTITEQELKLIESEIRKKVEKQIRIKIEEEHRYIHHHKHDDENVSPNKDDDMNMTKKYETKIADLHKKIEKLNQKLIYANKLITELIRQKAKWKHSQGQHHDQSYQDHQRNQNLMMQFRDCSFVPMCPPAFIEDLDPHPYF